MKPGCLCKTNRQRPNWRLAWVFHSGIFYYGVRKYIYESPVLEDKQQMINDAVDAFLEGFRQVFGTAGVPLTVVREVV